MKSILVWCRVMNNHESPCPELKSLKDETTDQYKAIIVRIDALANTLACHTGKIDTILQYDAPVWKNTAKLQQNPGTDHSKAYLEKVVGALVKVVLILGGVIAILAGMKIIGGI